MLRFRFTGLSFLFLFLVSCSVPRPGAWIKISGRTQGTTYNITYLGHDSIDCRNEIESVLHDFDLSLSTYIPGSIISRINQSEADVVPDPLFIQCFTAAKEVYEQSKGVFDITVAPLVNAWGFGFTERSDVDSLLIDSLLQFVGMDKVTIRDGLIWKEQDGVMLDMNAIAQGFAVDVLAGFLESKGISNYLVEIGGEIRTLGRNPNGIEWRVGIDKPIFGLQMSGVELEAVVSLSGQSLATSGNYRRFYELDGMKYSHTINPATGYPVSHGLLSATVLCRDCMHADAWATAFMVMGTEQSKAILALRPDLDAMLIYNNELGEYLVWSTKGMKEILD